MSLKKVSVDFKPAVPTYRTIQNGTMPPVSAVEKGNTIPSYQSQYRVYAWRWFMLVTVCLLNVSNGMMWLSYAAIPNYTADFYRITVNLVDYFSIIFFILSLVFGLVSIVVLDKLGLKIPLYIGATLNVVGSILRILSSLDVINCSQVPHLGFSVALIGQAITAIAQPFALYSPTTLAAVWFGPKERALCTTFASVANPIGIAIAQLSAPFIVTSASKIPTMLWIFTIPAAVTFFMTLVAFWYKEPPIPPAHSGGRDHIPPLFKGILLVLKNWSFWVLFIFWGGAAGLFNALLTLLPQILCPYGYTDRDSGLWGALMIFCGLVGATIAGVIIDYTKKYKEVSVVSMALTVLCFVWFMEVSTLVDQNINIAFSLCFFGLFALAQLPVCMELGVEITYPVAESISSGLLWSSAQVVGIAIVFICQALQTPMDPGLLSIQQCGSDVNLDTNGTLPVCINLYNATIPEPVTPSTQLVELRGAMIFCPTLTATLFVFYVAFFHPVYKRINAEKRANFEQSVAISGGILTGKRN